MKKTVLFAVIPALVADCATVQPRIDFVRNDGSRIAPGSADAAKFETDKTVCIGEAAKAKLSGSNVTVETGDPIVDGITEGVAEGKRNNEAIQVALGCLAQKGYKQFIPGQTPEGPIR